MIDSFASHEIMKITKGQIIFSKGDASERFFIVHSGEVMTFNYDGDSITPISLLREKDILDAESVFAHRTRESYAIAKTDCDLIPIRKDDVLSVVGKCPSWVNDILKTISERLRSTIMIQAENKISDNELDQFFNLHPEEKKSIINLLK